MQNTTCARALDCNMCVHTVPIHGIIGQVVQVIPQDVLCASLSPMDTVLCLNHGLMAQEQCRLGMWQNRVFVSRDLDGHILVY